MQGVVIVGKGVVLNGSGEEVQELSILLNKLLFFSLIDIGQNPFYI